MRSSNVMSDSIAAGTAPMPGGVELHGRPPTHLTYSGLSAAGVANATTTRHCPGISPVTDGRWPEGNEAVKVLDPTGIDLRRVAFAKQVHGVAVAFASRPGSLGTADIIVTTTPGLPLAIFTADCLAVVLHDPRRRALGVAHLGWRGTVRGGARVVVEALSALDASPARLQVAIAPSIGPCCYEVDMAVVEPLAVAFPSSYAEWLTPGTPGRWMLDLWAANEAQLVAAGVRPECIVNPRLCTACRRDLFHSYRKRDYGRLVTLAALPAAPRGPSATA
jgi:hypothetical protein